MMADLTKRMQEQLDLQRGSDSEARGRDMKKLTQLRHKVRMLRQFGKLLQATAIQYCVVD